MKELTKENGRKVLCYKAGGESEYRHYLKSKSKEEKYTIMMITRDTRVSAKELDTPEKHAMAVQAFVNAGFTKHSEFGNYFAHGGKRYTSLAIYSNDGDIYWNSDESNTTLEELLSAENSGFEKKDALLYQDETEEASWYDYSKQEALTFPPSGIWCQVLIGTLWWKVYIVGQDSEGFCVYEHNEDDQFNFTEVYDGDKSVNHFRPLDWDKLSKENLEKAKQRKELIDIISSAGNLSEGLLADVILNAGFKRNEK